MTELRDIFLGLLPLLVAVLGWRIHRAAYNKGAESGFQEGFIKAWRFRESPGLLRKWHPDLTD